MAIHALAIGKVVGATVAGAGWLFAVQTGVSQLALSVGDLVALGTALAGPPTVLVGAMWVHLTRSIRNGKADYRRDIANVHRKIERVAGNTMVYVQDAEARFNTRIDGIIKDNA